MRGEAIEREWCLMSSTQEDGVFPFAALAQSMLSIRPFAPSLDPTHRLLSRSIESLFGVQCEEVAEAEGWSVEGRLNRVSKVRGYGSRRP